MGRLVVVAMMSVALSSAVAQAQLARAADRHPAAPRPPNHYRLDTRVVSGRDTAQIRESIRDGQRSGQLSRNDAGGLRREANQIDTLATRYAQGGLSDAEARELQVRGAVLNDQVVTRRTQGFGNARTSAGSK